ncbi:MAG TPA: CARDB domain-containing protein [Candidatus Paceibacterota bacterium]|nr:CARDB domain-containing protein [Candidatus Paceibacterota bacterium]
MRFLLVFLSVAIFALPHIAEAGSSDNLSGWAWSSTIGWVSFNSTTGGGANYGVTVSDSGLMSGYAWSPNVGWITFNSSQLGGCPTAPCQANFNKQTGAVTGWARALAGNGSSVQTGGWGGWIQLSGSSYGVSATGCQWDGYAWGGGQNLQNGVIGWLSFSGSGYGVTGTGSACVASSVDLTAGAVTPTTATAGSAITLRANASNIGTAASGSFPVLFQVLETGARFNSSYLAAIAAGGSREGTASHTFSDEGTYSVRACANYNTSWANITAEGNYANNCGPWTTITVQAASSPALSCSVSNTSVSPGQSVTYNANPSGGATGPYSWSAADGGSYGTAATVTRTLTAPGVYAMNVDASNTAVSYCPTVSVSACPGSHTASIEADRTRVSSGSTITLNWEASGVARSCVITGPTGTLHTVNATSCNIPDGTITAAVTTQSTFTISCDSGEITDSVIVNVIPEFTEF